MLNKYFEYRKHKTNFKTEVIAGVTTFLTMAYIMFLNPFILSGEFAGTDKGFFDFGAVFTATILATAVACFIMLELNAPHKPLLEVIATISTLFTSRCSENLLPESASKVALKFCKSSVSLSE